MYTYFKNEVTVITLSDLVKDFDQIKMYKTVVIEKEFLQLPVTEKFRSIKNAYKVNVVVLITAKDELNYTFPVGAVDQLLVKPVTIQRVFNSIISLEERVDLPVMSKALKESANTQFNENFNQKVFEDFLGKRILLIENDKNNQQNILSLLGHSGINLSLANNMQESLLMLDKPGTFDLILLAAEVDGEEKLPLSRRIRHLNRYKGVPIIIMGVENKKVEVPGTDEVLTRPVAAGALYALFNHYLCVDEALFEKESVTLSQIAFINTVSLAARDGLEMASYDETLYKEILKEFMELYSDSDTQMNNVLVKDDLEALKELCLDIKGVAANIGAYNLADIAAKIHAAISNGMERHLMGLIQSYQPELEKVRDEIAAYLKS
jgi:CheY-like chemotaxis protein/HPt (histidine-containing phosphotransfer) domain-containing protein